jgi:type II secretory ATPase GspE/PulE/Tfp pilus assembly ATPase PilB-like protein
MSIGALAMIWPYLSDRLAPPIHTSKVGHQAAHRITLSKVGMQGVLPNQSVDSIKLLFDLLSIDPQGMSDHLCPVRLGTGQCLVLVLQENAQDDQTHATVQLLRTHRLPLFEPPIVVVTPSFLGALNRHLRHPSLRQTETLQHTSQARHVLFAILDDLVKWGLNHSASDMHLNVNPSKKISSVRFTVTGLYVRPNAFQDMTAQVMLELLGVIWMSVQGGNGAVFDPHREQQGRLTRVIAGQTILLRWASIATDSGPSVCLRLLGNKALSDLPSLESLGYFKDQTQALRRSRLSDGGAVVFAGLVGSGKSTTLAALLRELPTDRKLITLEDPVEYVIENALQCSVAGSLDEEANTTFDRKLKAIKRSAVQDLLIGEIRDQAGGRAFADLLLAGVNVYTTVHAASALQILNRLASNFIGVPRSVLAMPGMLKLLVYQALLPKLCEGCRFNSEEWLGQPLHQCALGFSQDRTTATNWLLKWCEQHHVARNSIRFRNPTGCPKCLSQQGIFGAGYAGRTVVSEIIEPIRLNGFAHAIESESMTQLITLIYGDAQVMQINQRVRERGLQKVAKGEIDPREIDRRFGEALYD